MKILILTPYLTLEGIFGRIPRIAYGLGHRLTKKEHEVHVFTSTKLDVYKKTSTQNEELSKMHIHRFSNFFRQFSGLISGINNFKVWKKFKKIIPECDLLIIMGFQNSKYLKAAKIAQKLNKKIIIIPLGQLSTEKGYKALKNSIFNFLYGHQLLNIAHKIVPHTINEEQILTKLGIPESKTTNIPLALDVDHYKRLPPKNTFRIKYQIPNTDKLILYMGRFHKYKFDDLLIYVFAKIIKKESNTKLIIAGRNDGYLTHIRKLILKLNLEEYVIFPGELHGQEKLAALNDAEIYCAVPYMHDDTSLSALEALASSNPVVSTELMEIPYLEKYEAGVHVKHNAQDLETALEDLLGNFNKCARMGENARNLAEKIFSWEKVFPQYEELFEKLIKNN